ncbi:MAG: RC-LH1 core complex protein PufX [Pseudomonadota bacterium]
MNDMSGSQMPTDPSDRRERIRAEILMQMGRGAFFAASVVFGPILFIYAVYLLGTLLPPESKEAVDPTPDSFFSATEETDA